MATELTTTSESPAGPPVSTLTDESLLEASTVETTPYEGQLPGTSGLRKKTKVWQNGTYTHNFIASILLALDAEELKGSTIIVSGDGRYYSTDVIQLTIQIAAAYGVARVWVGQNGLLSTPAVSAIIREREGGVALGGIVLTASHNPGGPDDDFGIKYNVSSGGPAPVSLTDKMYDISKTITEFKMCSAIPEIDLSTIGRTVINSAFEIEVIDSCEDLLKLYHSIFDLEGIKKFVARSNFSLLFDGLSGVAGAYAKSVFVDLLGLDEACLVNCTPLPDFGGGHPDPNLIYAKHLVKAMGLLPDGTVSDADASTVPDFGAAADGDADRNMVLGRQVFVTPSDSVAIIAANAGCIPFFKDGVKGVARSMPTSCALDKVATKLGLPFFEVPTGWKFFGNLMDSTGEGMEFTPFICGEESFGTGSNHVREKDGLWAVLAWLQILAARNADVEDGAALVSVNDIVTEHWKQFGRNYYCRYDYEAVESEAANKLMDHLKSIIADTDESKASEGTTFASMTLASCDEFNYTDPVDGSITLAQGLRFYFTDGSRVVFRLSGTGSVGATVRMYLEKYESDASRHNLSVADALEPVVEAALELAKISEFTGRAEPSVIT